MIFLLTFFPYYFFRTPARLVSSITPIIFQFKTLKTGENASGKVFEFLFVKFKKVG